MGDNHKEIFLAFANHGKGEKNKVKDMDGKNFSKCCKDSKIVDGKKCTTTDVDIEFSNVKTKGARVITYEQFKTALTRLAVKRFKGDPEAVEKTFKLIEDGGPKNTGVTKTSKTGGVEKMTDTSQYTGAHKERFGADGKGKGLDGREERVENTGYVGDYKNKDTFDDKVKK